MEDMTLQDLQNIEVERENIAKRLNFHATPTRLNPIADFALIDFNYTQAYKTVHGVEPEPDLYSKKWSEFYQWWRYDKGKTTKEGKDKGKKKDTKKAGAGDNQKKFRGFSGNQERKVNRVKEEKKAIEELPGNLEDYKLTVDDIFNNF